MSRYRMKTTDGDTVRKAYKRDFVGCTVVNRTEWRNGLGVYPAGMRWVIEWMDGRGRFHLVAEACPCCSVSPRIASKEIGDMLLADPAPLPPPRASKRPETGAMVFGSDWPGVFIRGDDAANFTRAIGEGTYRNPIQEAIASGLLDLLRSADVRNDAATAPQRLRDFTECLPGED